MFAGSMLAVGMSAPLTRGVLGEVADFLTAAGTTQADAYPMQRMTSQYFTTVAAGAGALIPTGMAAGEGLRVYNAGANSLTVYPPVGGVINALATNGGISVPSGSSLALCCMNLLKFFTIGGGGAGTPGGSDTEVQYNDGGVFGGNAAFTFNDATLLVTLKKAEGTYLQLRNVAGTAVGELRILESTDAFGGSVGLGLNALALCGPDLYNVAIGPYALAVNTVGASNVAIGEGALAANDADDNTAVGEEALYANTSGIGNTAVGQAALTSNTTGGRNTALGYGAMGFNEDGDENIAIGSSALKNNVSGDHNIAIGRETLQAHTASVGNTAIGYRAGVFFAGPSADYNTIMGWQAGDNFDDGSGANVDLGAHPTDTATTIGVHNNCIILGYDLNLPNDTSDGEMTIGNLIFGTGLGAVGKTVSTGKVGIKNNNPTYDFDVTGEINASAGFRAGGTAGITTTITTANLVGKTVTVTNGIITAFA